jgi:hypothetical protein
MFDGSIGWKGKYKCNPVEGERVTNNKPCIHITSFYFYRVPRSSAVSGHNGLSCSCMIKSQHHLPPTSLVLLSGNACSLVHASGTDCGIFHHDPLDHLI